MNPLNVSQHVQFFSERLQGLPNRLGSIYSVYRYFAEKVNISIVDVTMTRSLQSCVKYFVCSRPQAAASASPSTAA